MQPFLCQHKPHIVNGCEYQHAIYDVKQSSVEHIITVNLLLLRGADRGQFLTSISANADGLRDAASRKIDHIALPTKYNYQATSVG